MSLSVYCVRGCADYIKEDIKMKKQILLGLTSLAISAPSFAWMDLSFNAEIFGYQRGDPRFSLQCTNANYKAKCANPIPTTASTGLITYNPLDGHTYSKYIIWNTENNERLDVSLKDTGKDCKIGVVGDLLDKSGWVWLVDIQGVEETIEYCLVKHDRLSKAPILYLTADVEKDIKQNDIAVIKLYGEEYSEAINKQTIKLPHFEL